METTNKREFPANSIRLCFDGFDEEVCSGRICGVALEEEIAFYTSADLIIKIDDAFNRIGKPQPHQVLRSFHETSGYQSYKVNPERYHSSEDIAEYRGKLWTADLMMLSRHRAEWQGVLRKVDGSDVGRFDSIVECMELLEQSLTTHDD